MLSDECGKSGERQSEETIYWLERLIESGIDSKAKLTPVLDEADELMAMLVASVKTVKHKSAK